MYNSSQSIKPIKQSPPIQIQYNGYYKKHYKK